MKNFEHIFSGNRHILIVIGVIFLAYGSRIFSLTIGIDTEVLINEPDTPYNWLIIGRPGGVLLRWILELGKFTPFYASCLAAIFLLISYIIWNNLFTKYLLLSNLKASVFWLLFIIHPIWEEQMYFELQLVQISAGLALLGIVMNGCFVCATKRYFHLLIPVILGTIFVFSIYQSFVILFITFSCLLFLLYYKDSEIAGVTIWQYCLIIISIFLISYIAYSIIVKIWFSSSDYLTSQVQWGILNPRKCIDNIFRHMVSIVRGDGIFFSLAYAFSATATMVAATMKFVLFRKNSKFDIRLLAVILFEASPFLLTIYMGDAPLIRTQWALPFVIAGNFILLLEWCPKTFHLFLMLSVLIVGGQHFYTVNRLEYTDKIRYQNDVQISNMIIHDIEKLNIGNKPVAFIGNRAFNIPASGCRGEIIGFSFFDFDMISEPRYYVRSYRIVGFMNAIGIDIQCIYTDDIISERHIA